MSGREQCTTYRVGDPIRPLHVPARPSVIFRQDDFRAESDRSRSKFLEFSVPIEQKGIALMTSEQPGSVRINRERLLERFLRYVRVGTAADSSADVYPSSPGQRELGKLLCEELAAMSVSDAHQDDNALVWGTVPATDGGTSPTVALVAHVDTSPEAPGDGVNPCVIESYEGGDIMLASGAEISVSDCPDLRTMLGKTLVTTDGTTLLGGDDKAGVAIIMELANTLIENPHLMHGPVRSVDDL